MKMVLSSALLLSASPAVAQDHAVDTAKLQHISQALIDSIAPGNSSLYDRYLDPALVHVDENDIVRDKAAFMKEIRPLPAGIIGTSKVEDFRATFAGDMAFTTFVDQERVDFYGQGIHTRFRISDTWHRTPAGWRILGEHIGAILKDPPAIALSGNGPCSYTGTYRLTPEIATKIRCEGDHIVSERQDRPPVVYKAEVKDMFFAPGSPRSRRVFLRDATGAITGFADRREGEDAVWKRIG